MENIWKQSFSKTITSQWCPCLGYGLKALENKDTLLRTRCCSWSFLCCANWKHLLRTQNVSEQNQKHFCVPGTKFVSATNVANAGKRGNVCVGNNVSSFARALTFWNRTSVNVQWYTLQKNIFRICCFLTGVYLYVPERTDSEVNSWRPFGGKHNIYSTVVISVFL